MHIPSAAAITVHCACTRACAAHAISHRRPPLAHAVFLLSNNHVNELIASGGNGEHGVFDRFGEEEVLAYWISFLKTLSLSANANTVQFFLTYAPDGRDVGFPLYTQAIKYFTHPDSMVRTSVRTITLNVYQSTFAARTTRPDAGWPRPAVASHASPHIIPVCPMLLAVRDPLVRNMLLTNESDFPRKVARQLADMVRNMSTRLEHVSTTAREGAARLSPTSIRHAFARRAAAEGHTAGIISGRDGRSCSGSSSVYAATSSVADRSMSESCGTSLGTGPRWVPVEGMDSLNWQLPTCNEVYAVHSLLQRRANSVCSAKKEAANEGVDAASSGGSHTGARSFSAPHSHSSSDDNLSVAVEAPVVESDAAHRDQTAIFATIERQLADMSDIMSDVYDSIMYVQDIFAIQEREAAEAPTPVAARSARKVKRPQPELDVSFAPFCDALVDALMNELVEPLLLRSLRYTAM
ncbi:MAG: hypothetical protein EOO65_03590 [Methanosarcinales archaeon]|nr:MAG: hypothetical protein EOO65_03590 [Methanosarcinales archaeon]